jgi:hypothetical protein
VAGHSMLVLCSCQQCVLSQSRNAECVGARRKQCGRAIGVPGLGTGRRGRIEWMVGHRHWLPFHISWALDGHCTLELQCGSWRD